MLFNSSEEIKNDILNKISEYLVECIKTNTPIDKINILSLIRTYFYELQIRNIIYEYLVDILENTIIMKFYCYNGDNENNLNVDLFNHIRKMKISKIYKKTIENFLV